MRNLLKMMFLVALLVAVVSSVPACGGGAGSSGPAATDDGGGDGDGDGDQTGDDTGDETIVYAQKNILEFALMAHDYVMAPVIQMFLAMHGVPFDSWVVPEEALSVSKYEGAREDIFGEPDCSIPYHYESAIGTMDCTCMVDDPYALECYMDLDWSEDFGSIEGTAHMWMSLLDTLTYDLDDGAMKLTLFLNAWAPEMMPGIVINYEPGIKLSAGLGDDPQLPQEQIVYWVIVTFMDGWTYLNLEGDTYTATSDDDMFGVSLYFPELAELYEDFEGVQFICYLGDELTCDNTGPIYEDCVDGIDNDYDGLVDCDDDDCNLFPACNWLEDCLNGVDDDGDTLIDCLDPECQFSDVYAPFCVEICNNGVDDDGDNLVDCDDVWCFQDPVCEESCDDEDDDLDGDGVDGCEDFFCMVGSHTVDNSACNVCGGQVNIIPQCFDGDYVQPPEPGVPGSGLTCENFRGFPFSPYATRPSCVDHPTLPGIRCCPPSYELYCDDGFDNDFDGLTDCLDYEDCSQEIACIAYEWLCDDGVDNNGNGHVDCDDSDCMGFPGCPEICYDFHNRNPWTYRVCDDENGNGLYNCEDPLCCVDSDNPDCLQVGDPGYAHCAAAVTEGQGQGNCADGDDNDMDCLVDCDDDDCTTCDVDGICDHDACETADSCPDDCLGPPPRPGL